MFYSIRLPFSILNALDLYLSMRKFVNYILMTPVVIVIAVAIRGLPLEQERFC